MANERLRDALLRHGLTPEHVARAIKVDPKTVERSITKGRPPYPKHRYAVAAMVRETETYLWPDAVPPERVAEVGGSEIVKVYPHRNDVPRTLWGGLIDDATEEIEILAYAAMFLMESPTILKQFRSNADAGAKIRLLFGDPTSREVLRRSEDEQIGKSTVGVKIRNVLTFFRALEDVPGIEIRCHATTLYNSIYRFDDQMIVNTHVYGIMAAHAPALHLRQLSVGDLFEMYSESFETVWNLAKTPKW